MMMDIITKIILRKIPKLFREKWKAMPHGKKHNLKNRRFGKLKVIEEAYKDKGKNIHWKCICDCGTETFPAAHTLVSGHTKSCGCTRIESIKKLNI